MKAIRILAMTIFVVSIIAFVVYYFFENRNKDITPPTIQMETDVLHVSISETDLLQGVTAYDNKSGDVTHTLVVENVSPLTEEGKRIITYAAMDEQNNLSRKNRDLVYTDYSPPVFSLSGPLSYREGSPVYILPYITAYGALDGDLTKNIKISVSGGLNINVPGKYPVDIRVTDSAGSMAILQTELEIVDRLYSNIDVTLTDYLVYLKVGDSFNPNSYYLSSDEPGKVTTKSDVDTKTPGVYAVDYYVEGNTFWGKSRLMVVVE